MPEDLLLRAENVTKSYAGIEALRGASFELRPGEVHALVGENGAGKSTLIKIITGAVQADDGAIEINGEAVTDNSPSMAKSLGIAAIYQQPALFPDLSVAENISIGQEKKGMLSIVDWRSRRRRASKLLDSIGARIDPDTDAGDLTMPEQQLVEIARALGANAKILILDEPTASLSEEDVSNLFRVIRDLRSHGVGLIYISHRLEELSAIADRVTVLRDGQTISTRQISDVGRDELIHLMVGRELSAIFPKKEVEAGETVLELQRLSCRDSGIKNIDLTVRAGEIVGIAGLVGSGRTALARLVFGLDKPDEGEVLLRGQKASINDPAEAIEKGIALLPKDRRRHGVILDFPITSNTTLAALDQISAISGIDFQKEREITADYTRRLGVKAPTIFASAATLSGGNQQKVALARWLVTKPSVLILDEPTQGIDVGAKAEIHALMSELVEQGVAIVMISSELPEIMGMSDRIAVMHDGHIVEILDGTEATQQRIMALALGHNGNAEN